jgi:hypothetical protein
MNSENQNADRNTDNKDCAHEVSDGNEDSTGNWTRGHLHYSLAKSLPAFCPCLKTLWG